MYIQNVPVSACHTTQPQATATAHNTATHNTQDAQETQHTTHTTNTTATERREERREKREEIKRDEGRGDEEKREEQREERCVSRLIEGTNLAILVRRKDLTHRPPTIYDSQPDHHQNVHYSTGKSDDEPKQSKSSQLRMCTFTQGIPECRHRFWAPEKRKKRNTMKKEETFFKEKQKKNKVNKK